MSTADTDLLQERRVLEMHDITADQGAHRCSDERAAGLRRCAMEQAAAVLPLIAAEVQAAKAEALRNLPPHLSLQIHQCKAREGGGSYCALEKGHSGDHRILGVPDEWVLGAADRYIEQIETGDQA